MIKMITLVTSHPLIAHSIPAAERSGELFTYWPIMFQLVFLWDPIMFCSGSLLTLSVIR